jgi:hypothetical protein
MRKDPISKLIRQVGGLKAFDRALRKRGIYVSEATLQKWNTEAGDRRRPTPWTLRAIQLALRVAPEDCPRPMREQETVK